MSIGREAQWTQEVHPYEPFPHAGKVLLAYLRRQGADVEPLDHDASAERRANTGDWGGTRVEQ
jgi:hypothetical protein